MNKRALITSVILITVSIVGLIPSTIMAVPDIVNITNEIRIKAEEEVLLYNKEEKIDNINIDTRAINVSIQKSYNNEVYVKSTGYNTKNTVDILSKDNTLNITQREAYESIPKNPSDYIDYLITEMFGSHEQIIIYIPEKANMNINTVGGSTSIDDDIVKSDVNFKTQYGHLSLDTDQKTIKNVNIKSREYIRFMLDELKGVENLNVEAGYLEIMGEDVFSDEYLNDMPTNITLRCDTTDIDSKLPIAKKLNIYNEGHTSLDLPYMTYNIDLDLNSSDRIEFDEEDSSEYNDEYDYEEDTNEELSEPLKTYKGRLNNVNDEKSYSVNVISSGTIEIDK